MRENFFQLFKGALEFKKQPELFFVKSHEIGKCGTPILINSNCSSLAQLDANRPSIPNFGLPAGRKRLSFGRP